MAVPYKNREDKLKHNHKYFRYWYERNGKARNRNPDYLQTIKEWAKNNPERVKASGILKYAVKTKKIIKPIFCQNCNRKTKLVGHHRDYSIPLEVIWLCSSCHKLEHSKLEA